MKPYEKMTKREAAAALQEFLEERPSALMYLAEYLSAHNKSAIVLDETVESLIPLWRWVKTVLKERKRAETETGDSPSWLRYSLGEEPTLSPESVAIVDGVISYICTVVQRGAPGARWRLGFDRHKRYIWQNHPVLATDGEEVPVAAFVPGAARGHASGRHPSDDDKLARAAAAAIERLNGLDEETVSGAEPLIEVENLGDDAIHGREMEVSLREDIAHEHSRNVDRLAKDLEKQDGITGVIREDREVLLVATPTWSTSQLDEWVTHYLKDHIRGLDAPQQ